MRRDQMLASDRIGRPVSVLFAPYLGLIAIQTGQWYSEQAQTTKAQIGPVDESTVQQSLTRR